MAAGWFCARRPTDHELAASQCSLPDVWPAGAGKAARIRACHDYSRLSYSAGSLSTAHRMRPTQFRI